MIHRLLDIGSPVKTAIILDDADTVLRAQQVGVGSVGRFSIGAGKDPMNTKPVIADAYVRSLHDGRFKMEGPAGRGFSVDIGAAAVLSIGNIDVLVCHKTGGNGDLQLYRNFGIEPTFYQMVVVKACTSYRSAYEPIAAGIYLADTPGAASPNLKSFQFQKLPKHFYPFSHLDGYQVQQPVRIRPQSRDSSRVAPGRNRGAVFGQNSLIIYFLVKFIFQKKDFYELTFVIKSVILITRSVYTLYTIIILR